MTEPGAAPSEVIVVGTTSDVRVLAERLDESRSVVFVTDRREQHRLADRAGLSTHVTSLDAGLGDDELSGDVAIVATDRDSTNLLIAQHFRVGHDVEAVIARVNDADRKVAFDGIATETITPVDLYDRTVQETLEPL
ncbi:NAD-binding protein [Halorhabdus amylolytica]|uniref:NAD-binding protein n=1 Tax=Halorhabdus amylolytica TaxID=2559573 RepID=UPI0010AB11CF|nr:NAD-binding protein [Halorhabdus amylolytica]